MLRRLAECLQAAPLEKLHEQWSGLTKLDEQVAEIERRMCERKKKDEQCRRARFAALGLPTANAAPAMMGDAKAFRSGRHPLQGSIRSTIRMNLNQP
ncbi:hypothetical protein DIE21_15465 [Burkholderia sp. Bp9140]|nr:hypothetical protein DIE21_15465 [Burkholderia sp. Bp9140]